MRAYVCVRVRARVCVSGMCTVVARARMTVLLNAPLLVAARVFSFVSVVAPALLGKVRLDSVPDSRAPPSLAATRRDAARGPRAAIARSTLVENRRRAGEAVSRSRALAQHLDSNVCLA
jgi:hypothetical protein